MNNKKQFIIFFILCFFLFNKVLAEEKIAFIDLNYVFLNSNAGKKINKDIQNRTKKNNEEFQNLKVSFDEKKKKILAQKNVLAKEEYKKKIIELEKDINEQNVKINKKNNDLNDYKKKAKIEFSNQLRLVLEEYVKTNSISMILRKENLLIGKNNLDVTSGILELFNEKVKSLKVN